MYALLYQRITHILVHMQDVYNRMPYGPVNRNMSLLKICNIFDKFEGL